MFHLRASVALWRGKSPARAGRIALIKLRRVARPPVGPGGARRLSHHRLTTARNPDHARAPCACVATRRAGAWAKLTIRMLDAFLGEVSDPCEREVDESGEECGELFGLVSFLFGFIGVRAGNMAYYTWVSMGASMPGAACFLSLRVCALAWLG